MKSLQLILIKCNVKTRSNHYRKRCFSQVSLQADKIYPARGKIYFSFIIQ